jgi:predicted GTPase
VSTVAGEKIQALFGKIGTFNYEDTLKNILQSIKKPNILVCGGTGVGKSSLINYVFDKDVAEVGSGTAVTDEIRRYASSQRFHCFVRYHRL